jgi:hypothetical protein
MVEWKASKLILWLTSILFALNIRIHAYKELLICPATRVGAGAENYCTQYCVKNFGRQSFKKFHTVCCVIDVDFDDI